MKFIRRLDFVKHNASSVSFQGGDAEAEVFVLEPTLFRVVWKKKSQVFKLGRSWSIAPGRDSVPVAGRDRSSLDGFSLPKFDVEKSETKTVVKTAELELHVRHETGSFELIQNGQVAMSERITGAVALGARTRAHFLNLDSDAKIFGLGEAGGALDRRGRRFVLKNLDAMGYDAEKTDPLYKHFPFFIYWRPSSAAGIFYDNFATAEMNFGLELDNYHKPYISYEAKDGDLDFYLIGGPAIRDVAQKFTWLTGRPAMPPAWSLKYSGSTMTYTDQPNSQEALQEFVEKVREHALSCGSFHLSSGYTSIGKRRYVFNWNRDKFPDPRKFIQDYHANGIKVVPNVKPVLLEDHPSYREAKDLFVQTKEGPELSQFWDGLGSHLDFTNPKTFQWWKANLTKALLDNGVEAIWNDNNEFEVWDDEAVCQGGGKPYPIELARPIQTTLMAISSREALLEKRPQIRPFVISRSGMPGLQKFVQTWSGDNRTDWKTIKFNLNMALNLSLSGVSNTGHDIGGFSGPRPDPELFLRWIQHGIFYPRFVIHSWKEDGVNEPWMYPELMDDVRAAFRLRDRLEPYFYSLLKASHENFEMIMRPMIHEFDGDAQAREIEDQFFVGTALLVANVMEPGEISRRVYLPEYYEGWFDFHTGQHYKGAEWIEVPIKLSSIPVFVRGGSVIPLNREDGKLEMRAFDSGHGIRGEAFIDDGEIFPFLVENGLTIRVRGDATRSGRNSSKYRDIVWTDSSGKTLRQEKIESIPEAP